MSTRWPTEEYAILSRPYRVMWAGWETDTRRLQQAGWKLAVDTAQMDSWEGTRYTLVMHHEGMKLWALCDDRHINFHQSVSIHANPEALSTFIVRHVANDIHVRTMGPVKMAFQQINAEPAYGKMEDMVDHSLANLNIFHLGGERVDEVLFDKADLTVVDHLEAIKKLQAPRQKEIREKMLREESDATASDRSAVPPKSEVVANLIYFPGSAAG